MLHTVKTGLYNHPNPSQTSQKFYISVVTAWAAHRAHAPSTVSQSCLCRWASRKVRTHTSELVLVFAPPPETPSNCLELSRFYICSGGDLMWGELWMASFFLFAQNIIWTYSNAEWFCRTATSVFWLPKFLSPFKKDLSSSLTLSCSWSLASAFRRQPVFIISDANRFLLTHYSLRLIIFLKYLLVLSHVLLNKEKFRLPFVTSVTFGWILWITSFLVFSTQFILRDT